jgi:hypothetical protein
VPKFTSLAIGAGELAAYGALSGATAGTLGAALAPMLLTAGIGSIVGGIGTLLSSTPTKGIVTTEFNPAAAWEYVYGRCRTGGKGQYENPWPAPGGDTAFFGGSGSGNDQVIDLVIVLAAHQCASIDALLFDGQRVQIDSTSGICSTSGTAVTWNGGANQFNAPGIYANGPIVIAGAYYTIASISSNTSLTLITSAGTQSGVGYLGGGSAPQRVAPQPATNISAGTSFTPAQQTVKYTGSNPTTIQRVNGVVTVTLSNNIPYLIAGDSIQLTNVPGDLTLNGRFIVNQVLAQNASGITFTFLSGGPNSTVTNAGWITTLWADYGRTVYFEPMMGDQVLGQTFAGMEFGTPYLGNMNQFISPANPTPLQGEASANPWTGFMSLQGKCAVLLRLIYSQQYYKGGIPKISFLMRGKNTILDPRTGTDGTYSISAASFNSSNFEITYTIGSHLVAPGNTFTITGASNTAYNLTDRPVLSVTSTTVTVYNPSVAPGAFTGSATGTVGVYTENSALCAADFLTMSEDIGGFGATYGPNGPENVPFPQLIAAANVCDEAVNLAAGGTEPAYACNGKFDLDESRGSILANLLTSCAGRITDTEGAYVIWPAAWVGNSFAIGSNPGGGVVSLPAFSAIAVAPIKWRLISVRDLYNGVKGTYMSPANKWLASDFPPYAQDSIHGYTSGPPQYDFDANLAADGGNRRWKDVAYRFTITPSAAQRLAKVELVRCRLFESATLAFNLTAYQIVAMDLLLITVPYLNWTAKQLEVQADRLRIEPGEEGMGPSFAVELDVKEADPNQYNWNTSEELTAQGYQQASSDWTFAPAESVPGITVPYPWKPASVAPLVGDAVFSGPVVGSPRVNEGQASFGMQVVYGTDASGNATANLNISGALPPNALSLIDPPQITCVAGTSGNLPAGTYIVTASALDTGTPARNSVFGVAIRVTIPVTSPPTSNGSIAVTVAWPFNSNGGEIYMAEESSADGYCFQAALTSSTTTDTITNFAQATPGAPDSTADHVAVAWAPVEHGGVWAQQVQAVTSTTITIGGSGMTVNQWAGYVLTLYGKLDPTQPLPILNMPVASNTASAGTPAEFVLTIGPNANGDQLPNLTTLLDVGDLLVMRGNYTFGASSFSDPNVANPYFPSGATGVEAGHVAIVMSGPDAGDIQTIASVSLDGFGHSIIFELAGTWSVQPNSGDIIIVASGWGPETPGQSFSSPSRGVVNNVVCSPQVTNLAKQAFVFIARMQDVNDVNGADAFAPMRDQYLFGFQGTRTITTSQTMLATDRIILIDASAGPVTLTLLPFSEIGGQDLYIAKIDSSANAGTVACTSPDTINGNATVVLAIQFAPLSMAIPNS